MPSSRSSFSISPSEPLYCNEEPINGEEVHSPSSKKANNTNSRNPKRDLPPRNVALWLSVSAPQPVPPSSVSGASSTYPYSHGARGVFPPTLLRVIPSSATTTTASSNHNRRRQPSPGDSGEDEPIQNPMKEDHPHYYHPHHHHPDEEGEGVEVKEVDRPPTQDHATSGAITTTHAYRITTTDEYYHYGSSSAGESTGEWGEHEHGAGGGLEAGLARSGVNTIPTTTTTTMATTSDSLQKWDSSTDALIAAGADEDPCFTRCSSASEALAGTAVREAAFSAAGEAVEPHSTPLPQAPHGWPALSDFPKWYWKRLTGFDQSLDVYTLFAARWDVLIGFVFCAMSLLVLGFLEHFVFVPMVNGPMVIFIPAMSATATCLFTFPKLPVSQPRTILIGHVSAGVIGVSLMNIFIRVPQQPYGLHLAGAIGVGVHQLFMIWTNTLHPPSSATVVSAVFAYYDSFYNDKGFIFCVTPCITGSLVLIIMSILLNNLVPWRSPYPQYW